MASVVPREWGTIDVSADRALAEITGRHVMAEQYYYCLDHKSVESEDGCKSADRLGPYSSRDEATHALEKVEQRNEAWDTDPRWNDD
ncbi:MAG: hypothetical protein M3423_07940 [Actinomycetota bacterium]|nr:hypothetical protein [Actinomycetota bacterium]